MKNIKKVFILVGIIYIFCNVIYSASKDFVNITSPAAVVIDSKTGRVLYDKNANEKRKIASLTKIMTSIMLVENCQMNEIIEVPSKAAWIGGSEVGLKAGDKVTAETLLYGMLLPSGNDAAYTVGLHLGGTAENFGVMMTKKAKEIGAINSNFTNPHGLDANEHYSTAKDLAIITRYAMKNENIDRIMGTKSATVNLGSYSKTLSNTNRLLKNYPEIDGGKTGFTNGANRCLMATATKNNSRYIAVVLGATDTDKRFNETKQILDECFNRYKVMDISKYLNFYINIPVIKGNIDYYERKITDTMEFPLTEEEYEAIYVKQTFIEKIEAPMAIGTKIGDIEVSIGDEIIYKKEVFLEENIYKKTMKDYILDSINNMFKPRLPL